MPEAKKEWERLAELMNQMGVLTEVDMAAFAAYCQSYARWKEAQEHITSGGSTFETDKGYQQQTPWVGIANTNQKLMLQAASEFGLTPSSRSRIIAGNDRHSIAFELHTKAVDILEGRRVDPTFYPVVYGLKDDEDWEDEANWYKVNPSLGYTVDIERLRDAYREAKQNPADEVTFKWLRMNMWVSSTTSWIPDAIFMKGNEPIDMRLLEGRDCYAGLDLSSTGDITALVLIFPPRNANEKYTRSSTDF